MANESTNKQEDNIAIYHNWRDLIKPDRLIVDPDTHDDSYGKFICQPLERGFATTMGNSLRRILLSSIQGVAITAVKIEGTLHEFSTVSGILEDVTEIILNLKEIRLQMTSNEAQVVRIDETGKGAVTAADIITGTYVEVMNPEKHICTITNDNAGFVAELEVNWGKGYVPAEKQKKVLLDDLSIPIDAVFTPIKKVTSVVSQARVGQQTDYDKLTMEIFTDGSVRPEDALAFSAKILKDQMSVFVNFDEGDVEPPPEQVKSIEKDNRLDENLDRSVEELELSVRSSNCLRNANIRYIGELVQKTEAEMLKTKNFGRKSLNEIKNLLYDMNGLTLGVNIEGWIPPDKRDNSESSEN
ncbi:MAG: DNA-directed RNA polymerase subunit alpha [Thermodesulfobacteriota bacterium]